VGMRNFHVRKNHYYCPTIKLGQTLDTFVGELDCITRLLPLQQDDGVPILAEKLQAMVEVAGGVDVKALIYNIGSGVGSAPAAAAVVTASSAGGGAAAPAAVNEEKKNEESKEELDDDMGFGLFD
uniref:60S acidic ribosomal protein P2 n=1 Tax=Globodera pallida TaxID=36090 RepID=A0A183CRI3_GLOPA